MPVSKLARFCFCSQNVKEPVVMVWNAGATADDGHQDRQSFSLSAGNGNAGMGAGRIPCWQVTVTTMILQLHGP